VSRRGKGRKRRWSLLGAGPTVGHPTRLVCRPEVSHGRNEDKTTREGLFVVFAKGQNLSSGPAWMGTPRSIHCLGEMTIAHIVYLCASICHGESNSNRAPTSALILLLRAQRQKKSTPAGPLLELSNLREPSDLSFGPQSRGSSTGPQITVGVHFPRPLRLAPSSPSRPISRAPPIFPARAC
jgi:hypothetical protein